MQTVLEILFNCLAAVAVIMTSVSMLPFKSWWVRACDFPRQQIFWLGSAAIVLALFRDYLGAIDYTFLSLLLLSLLYQGFRIAPYTAVWKKSIQDADDQETARNLSLLISNVRQKNDDYEKALQVYQQTDADVLLLLEVDQKWVQRLSSLKERYKHFTLHPQENTYGMALFSKWEMIDTEVRFLQEKDVPSISTKLRIGPDQEVLLWCMHPPPPFPDEAASTRPRDQELLRVAELVIGKKTPVIVAGDLNDVAWSETSNQFCKISGLRDPRIGRGHYSTFHAENSFLRWPLDHIFLSSDFRLKEMKRLERIGSDHFPIFISASLQT